MLSNTPRLNFCYLKIIRILHQRYHAKAIGHILKNKQKSKCVCIHHIIQLIIMKMKNRSPRYDINRPKPRYSTHKKSLKMLLICIKQHISNIWSSVHEKVKQHWYWGESKRYLYKEACICFPMSSNRLHSFTISFVLALQLPCIFYLQKNVLPK